MSAADAETRTMPTGPDSDDVPWLRMPVTDPLIIVHICDAPSPGAFQTGTLRVVAITSGRKPTM